MPLKQTIQNMEPEKEIGLTINEIINRSNSIKLTIPYPVEVPVTIQLNRSQRRKAERLKKKIK